MFEGFFVGGVAKLK